MKIEITPIEDICIAAKLCGMTYGQYVHALKYGKVKAPEPSVITEERKKYTPKRNRRGGNANSLTEQQKIDLTRPVCCYDKAGNFIRSYPSANVAAEINGWKGAYIRSACRREHDVKSAYGFQWRFEGDDPPEEYRRAGEIAKPCGICGKLYTGPAYSRYCSKACAKESARRTTRVYNAKLKAEKAAAKAAKQ